MIRVGLPAASLYLGAVKEVVNEYGKHTAYERLIFMVIIVIYMVIVGGS